MGCLIEHLQYRNCKYKGEIGSADPHVTALHDCLRLLEHDGFTGGSAQQQQQQQYCVSTVWHEPHFTDTDTTLIYTLVQQSFNTTMNNHA